MQVSEKNYHQQECKKDASSQLERHAKDYTKGHGVGQFNNHSESSVSKMDLLKDHLERNESATGFAVISKNPMQEAFSQKRAVHAGLTGTPLEKEKLEDTLDFLQSQERTDTSVAYVHIPFCESKCLYCGFFGGKYTQELGAQYTNVLVNEIEREKDLPCVGTAPVQAVYLGGGTPTALQAPELKRIVNTLKSSLPLSNDCEVTVEGRIHNFDKAKIEACLEAGVNRFSLGVQCFSTERRQLIGRIASKEAVIARLHELASHNNAAIVIDLIYGLPGQTVAEWEDEVKTFLDLPIDGVDLYQLNVFPGHSLEKAIEAGKVPAAASLQEQSKFFQAGVEIMHSAHCQRLSLSHWGKTNRERNMYNPLTKSRASCLNYGSGAGGILQGYFLFNESNPMKYMEMCADKKPIIMATTPPAHLAVLQNVLQQTERCCLNFALVDALIKEELQNNAAPSLRTSCAPLLENWEKAGLIECNGDWVDFTLAGQFWHVNLVQGLILRLKEFFEVYNNAN